LFLFAQYIVQNITARKSIFCSIVHAKPLAKNAKLSSIVAINNAKKRIFKDMAATGYRR